MSEWWEYNQLESGHPYDWSPGHRGDKSWDQEDFHVDLGCGRVKKARLGIDLKYSPGVDLVIDLDALAPPDDIEAIAPEEIATQTFDAFNEEANRRGDFALPLGFLPFPDDSIESVISHHALEHIGDGFMRVMDEVHRVLKPGGLFRVIVPAFPSAAAVADPTHKRYFLEGTWQTWIAPPTGERYTDGFAEPYCTAAFILEDLDMSPLPWVEGTYPPGQIDYERLWGPSGSREFRVSFRKHQS